MIEQVSLHLATFALPLLVRPLPHMRSKKRCWPSPSTSVQRIPRAWHGPWTAPSSCLLSALYAVDRISHTSTAPMGYKAVS